MEFVNENSTTAYVVAIVTTCIVLVMATGYSLRNILRIWQAGKPKPVNEHDEEETRDGIKIESDELTDDDDLKSNIINNENMKKATSGGGDFRKAENLDDIDPMEYCEHIQSEVKKARQRVTARKLNQDLSTEDLQTERELQRKQLEDIFKLMEEQNEKFGVSSVDDVQTQMKLYA